MHEDIAQCFMDYARRSELGHANGSYSYPRRYLDWISVTAGAFFDKYPDLLTDEAIKLIGAGESGVKQAQFGHLKEFYPLNEALESYCNSLRMRVQKPYFFVFIKRILHWYRPQMRSEFLRRPASTTQ